MTEKTAMCNQYTKKHTLCCDCRKSVTDGCSWSREFEPVEGWTAIPTKIRINAQRGDICSSFIVVSCPEFDRDAIDFGQKRIGGRKPTEF